jgi:PhoH-like ATPase
MTLDNGTEIEIISGQLEDNLFDGLDQKNPDNIIIATALKLKKEGKDVVFVSNDAAARVKARKLGLSVESLEEDRVNIKLDDVYKGWSELLVSPDRIEEFYRNNSLKTRKKLLVNEFVLLKNEMNPKQTALAKYDGERLVPLFNCKARPWDISARNMEQKFLMDALMDPKIQLVTAMGTAGTGKSLLSIAAGGEQVIEKNMYKKMIIYKPVIPMGRDIGFLPGTEEEKLRPWMASVYDSLEFIFGVSNDKNDDEEKVRYLIDRGHIELCALTYIRGRSLPNLFIVLDEAQNISPHELKTLISRAGEGTKIVIIGDSTQIDNPYLDSQNNGLVYLIEKFKGQEIFAHVTLEKPERSTLSALATELL